MLKSLLTRMTGERKLEIMRQLVWADSSLCEGCPFRGSLAEPECLVVWGLMYHQSLIRLMGGEIQGKRPNKDCPKGITAEDI